MIRKTRVRADAYNASYISGHARLSYGKEFMRVIYLRGFANPTEKYTKFNIIDSVLALGNKKSKTRGLTADDIFPVLLPTL